MLAAPSICTFLSRLYMSKGNGGIILHLKVNGKDIRVAIGSTVAMLLEQQGLNPATVVVEHNHVIVRQEEWRDIVLTPGDCLEIVTFVGGG
jgi:sulfur carrier protein